MPVTRTVPLDMVIFGGGAAGLCLLDEAVRLGYDALLLEARELGAGQTVASQGIIHGGLKYSLGGLLTASASAIAHMPVVWRRCLAGEQEPNLSGVRLRAEYCHLWRSTSLSGIVGMFGARAGLRVTPVKIPNHARPAALAHCRGTVARIDEQVLEPASFVQVLADRHRRRLLRIDSISGLDFESAAPGEVSRVRLLNPDSGEPLDLQPKITVLAAGVGNETLAEKLDLSTVQTQRRPLHMILARGDLPMLNGHCVDGTSTRVTITTTTDSTGRTIWQIGGAVSEVGVEMNGPELIAFARHELGDVLPGVPFRGVQWATYRVDRAESATMGGGRPDDAVVHRSGNVICAWPTKLALAPRLAELIIAKMDFPAGAAQNPPAGETLIDDWPKPTVALPPWERPQQWSTDDSATPTSN